MNYFTVVFVSPLFLRCVRFSFRANSIKWITRNQILLRALIKTNGSDNYYWDLIIMIIISYSEILISDITDDNCLDGRFQLQSSEHRMRFHFRDETKVMTSKNTLWTIFLGSEISCCADLLAFGI